MKQYHNALAELFKVAAMQHDLAATGIAATLLELSTEPAKALKFWKGAKAYVVGMVDTLTVQEIDDYLTGDMK